jgi:hypothetical protein
LLHKCRRKRIRPTPSFRFQKYTAHSTTSLFLTFTFPTLEDYLGMELPREYDAWKIETICRIAPDKSDVTPDPVKLVRRSLQRALASHIDRLWYYATLEVMGNADVYDIGGKDKIPRLYTIDSPFEQKLGELEEQDAFRIFRRTYRVHMHEGNGFTKIQHEHEQEEFRIPMKTYVLDLSTNSKRTLGELTRDDLFEPVDTFEVLSKDRGFSVVRTPGGYVAKMTHFMRYSGLTGACINCMSFNNLVGQALRGVEFKDRIEHYVFETN